MPRNPFSITVLALSAALFATPAAADRWKDCAQQADPDLSIKTCTAIIESGWETAANSAIAYNNRGTAYYNKGEYDRAIADYTHAIKLNPNYAIAYTNRGNAHKNKGEYDRAIADYNRAIELTGQVPGL